MTTKKEQKIFKYTHPTTNDVFTYEDKGHAYQLNGIDLPGTTTPLKLVNELSWDADGKMTDKSQIIQQWAIKLVANEVIEQTKGKTLTGEQVEKIVIEAKKAPNKKFTGAGVSGTEIHDSIEYLIKEAIRTNNGYLCLYENFGPQVENFVTWAEKNKVKFLYSEEPIYSKEWMNCGTVDFICEINGKILIGDIKTNGDKRRYEWIGKGYDFSKPVSDIHIPALWQTAAYGKMATEDTARKLIDKFDGVVIVNIKKSGEFDEKLDVRYNYNTTELVGAYADVLSLYKRFRSLN
jgi:hypothetical protein